MIPVFRIFWFWSFFFQFWIQRQKNSCWMRRPQIRTVRSCDCAWRKKKHKHIKMCKKWVKHLFFWDTIFLMLCSSHHRRIILIFGMIRLDLCIRWDANFFFEFLSKGLNENYLEEVGVKSYHRKKIVTEVESMRSSGQVYEFQFSTCD